MSKSQKWKLAGRFCAPAWNVFGRRMIGLALSGLIVVAIAAIAAGQVAQPAQTSAQAVENAPLIHLVEVHGYVLDVTLDPAKHSLAAQAQVNFTALQNLQTVAFALNPALQVSSVVDGAGNAMKAEQNEGEIRVTAAHPLSAGGAATWTFTYRGVLDAASGEPRMHGDEPALAWIGQPVSYLLYRAHWFPVVGDGMNRFTASTHVHVPAGETVVGSGPTGAAHRDANGDEVFDFDWARSGFPGMIVAGTFRQPVTSDGGSHVQVYLLNGAEKQKPNGQGIAKTAERAYNMFAAEFGPTETGKLNVVELPDGTVPAAWAPEMAAIASRQLAGTDWSRLLANTIARQWWGNRVGPATANDAWITNGMCRYAELEYLGQVAKPNVVVDAIFNVSASALTYNVPLDNVARTPGRRGDSPEFQALTYDKGAIIFRMLRWQIGETAFQQTLRDVLSQGGQSISSATLEKIAEAVSHENLRPFFTQWLNDTGAPTLQDKWTLFRLGNNKGFRTTGEIDEDLDLFQMPVEVRIETEGKTVTQRVDVMGPQTQFTIDTFGIPRKVSLDPERRLLRNGEAMQVRVHILLGLAKAAHNNDAGAIEEYQAALALDPLSSLASYRLGEEYLRERNYQAAEDAFRRALSGDGVPKWTEVWSDVQLGKVFDAAGQRDRAVNEYREAVETGDDTSGALTLAGGYLQHPYAAATPKTRP